MRFIGITFVQDRVKMAIFCKKKHRYELDELKEIPAHEFVKEKNSCYVSSLPTEDIIRRDVHLKLRHWTSLRKALPFHLETILPFPMEEAVVYPQIFPAKGGADVIVFATTQTTMQKHLEMHHFVDPDIVTVSPIALYQWAKFFFPDNESITMMHDHIAIAVQGGKILFAQAFDHQLRMELFLRNHFPHYFSIPDEGPSYHNFSYEELKKFAIPIGLALEGLNQKGSQWRQKAFASTSKKNMFHQTFFISCATVSMLLLGFSGLLLYRKEQRLEKQIPQEFASKQRPLKEKISQWEKYLAKNRQLLPSLPSVPMVQDILSWICSYKDRIEIVNFHYSMVEYPTIDHPEKCYALKIMLKFTAENISVANTFKEYLKQHPSFIDPTKKIEWATEDNFYKISFETRARSA